MTGWNMVGAALSRLLVMWLMVMALGLFSDITWSWRWAAAMVLAGAAWDVWASRRPTDRRHYPVREIALPTDGLRLGPDDVIMALVDFEPNRFVSGGIGRTVAKATLPVVPEGLMLHIHHDVVEVVVGSQVLLAAPNPEHRRGRRHSIGVAITPVTTP